VEDLGYTDYAWYGQLTGQKLFFVTRQKSNARYRVLEWRPVNTKLGLVSDETIQLTGAKARECPKPLRRIVYRDPETEKVYVFLTNHFRWVAKTIADTAKIEGAGYTLGEQIQYTDIWANDNYLQFMYERLLLLKELLAEDGTIYLHCDQRRVHHLRCLMEEVFGADNFINELQFCPVN